MGNMIFSESAARKGITLANEAREQLLSNIKIMENEVNSQFSGLKDPTIKRYLELSGQMQELLKQIGEKLDGISEYCQAVIRWIQSYNEI